MSCLGVGNITWSRWFVPFDVVSALVFGSMHVNTTLFVVLWAVIICLCVHQKVTMNLPHLFLFFGYFLPAIKIFQPPP